MHKTIVPPFHGNIDFNAQHSPMGAFMSFTCGHFGTRGGFGLQIGKPGDQDLYIGIKDADRFSDAPLKCLPFYEGAVKSAAESYLAGPAEQRTRSNVVPYRADQIRRHYGWGSDRWITDDFEFAIYTPFSPIPDPCHARGLQLIELLPAVIAELTVDNVRGTGAKTAFFAMQPAERGVQLLGCDAGGRDAGIILRNDCGIAASASPGDEKAFEFCRWSVNQGLAEATPHLLGSVPGIGMIIPAGQRRTLRLVLGCFLPGTATTRLEGKYLYTRCFTSLENVLSVGFAQFDKLRAAAEQRDGQLLESGLSADQQFLIAHATRSYYGSTQLLDVGGEPFWVVNEGEYCMMNTLDLSIDQVFWELKHNPWVVRNVLDNFVRHYSYVDQHGLSFCHDMGAYNNFAPAGHSSYELPNLTGCFSYMTQEQLCNWVLLASCYVAGTNDAEWVRRNLPIFRACHESLAKRLGENGLTAHDSSRCEQGSEITTYDSLDHSLAQARGNVYIGVKCWAALRGIRLMLRTIGIEMDVEPLERRLIETLGQAAQSNGGWIPAVLEPDNPGFASRILPASEALLYPWFWDEEPVPPDLLALLRRHTLELLLDPQRRNLFDDGGIRLSSTSGNSWMSKIAIFQHVARRVMRLDDDQRIDDLFAAADAAHVKWQTEGESAYWACSDQMVDGVARASRFYPRIITAALWLEDRA